LRGGRYFRREASPLFNSPGNPSLKGGGRFWRGGEAPLYLHSPFPCSRGRGIKAEGLFEGLGVI